MSVHAQAPDGVNYQAVVRDVLGLPLNNQSVSVRFTIHQGSSTGPSVFQEVHATTTNQFGLINLELGSVDNVNFSAINWGTGGAYYLQIEVDGGSGFDDLGASQLLSVPYALFARSAATGAQGYNSLIDTASAGVANCPNGGYQVLMGLDANANTVLDPSEITSSFYVCNGSGVAVNTNDTSTTNELITSAVLTGTSIEITEAGILHNISLLPLLGLINITDTSATNELQTLSFTDPNLTLSNGGGIIDLSSLSGGLWQSSSPNIYFNSGYVGIGLTNPTVELDVAGAILANDVTVQNNFIFQDAGNTAPDYVLMDDGAGVGNAIWQHPDSLGISSSNLWQSNAPNIYFNTGNVGIGTATASSPLTVNTLAGAEIEFVGGFNSDITAPSQLNISSGGTTVMDASSIFLRTSLTDRLVISNGGNVGIGTNVPATKLHVETTTSENATLTTQIINDNSGASNFRGLYVLANSSGSATEFVGGDFQSFGSGSGTSSIGVRGNATGGVNNWAGYFEAGNVYIQNNVGIGTLAPSAKLHLDGTLRLDNLSGSGVSAGDVLVALDAQGNAEWQTPPSNSGAWSSNGTETTLNNITDNVGIGTTAPGKIAGSSKYFTLSRGDAAGGPSPSGDIVSIELHGGSSSALGVQSKIDFIARSTSGADVNTGRIELTNTSSNTGRGIMRFYTNPGSGLQERLTIIESGEVGIGTTTPSVMLDVAGSTTVGGNLLINGVTSAVGVFNADGDMNFGNAATDLIDFIGTVKDANAIIFDGATSGGFTTTLAITDPTANQTITLQDGTGTLAFLSDIGSGGIYNGSGTLSTSALVTHADNDVVFVLSGTGLAQFQVRGMSGFNALDVQSDGDIDLDLGTFFVDASSNNVGIGTTTPLEQIQLTGTNAAIDGSDGVSMLISNSNSTTGSTASINFVTNGGASSKGKTGLIHEDTGSNGIGKLHLAATSTTTLAYKVGVADAKLTVQNDGYVGIGTTSPRTPLAILGNGGAQPVGITQNAVGGTATMELTTQDGAGNQATRLKFGGNGNTPDAVFYSGASGSETAIVHIEGTNGNVGIGTTAPAYKLDVSGEARIGYHGSPDTIPLVPSDFLIVFGESAMHQFGENWGIGPIQGQGTQHFIAQIPIPVGYKARKAVIKTYRDDNNYSGNPHDCFIWSMKNQISQTAAVPFATASVTGDGIAIATFSEIVAHGNAYVGIEVRDIPELPGFPGGPVQEMITGGYVLIQQIVP